jgi:ABC-type branched-subunit amino acid transport system substrate-binding protein
MIEYNSRVRKMIIWIEKTLKHGHFYKWPRGTKTYTVLVAFLVAWLPILPSMAADPGVTNSVIRIGSTQPLQGDLRFLGEGMTNGMQAALKGAKIQGRQVELSVRNDSYNPSLTVEAAQALIEQGTFLMLGSTASQTTKAVLPILAKHQLPAVGFYTGAAFRGPGDVLNFRASYAQEVATAVENVLATGVKPTEVCAYVQNDAYGMAGLEGISMALIKQPGMGNVVGILNQLLAMEGDDPPRNNVGPVGVNRRGTLTAREGYQSLKAWEKKTGDSCRFIVTVLNPLPTVQFINYALGYKGEKWVVSVPSPAVNNTLMDGLKKPYTQGKIIATGVLPPVDNNLPIIKQARDALGSDINAFSLEGYVVGKLFLTIMNNIQGELTRANFLAAARAKAYDIGGLAVDFTTDNQGSDFVQLSYFQDNAFKPMGSGVLQQAFQ